MKTHTWMLVGTMLALPALGLAQEHAAAKPAPAASTPVAKPTFDLRNAGVQDVIRANAVAQQPLPNDDLAASESKNLKPLPFRAPRRLHHMDCDSFNCVAYTADDVALYTIPRDQYFGVRAGGGNPQEDWLSCQSGNDLLTTFERYDKCRGVSIGLPLQVHGVKLDLANITLRD